jgi:SAM-dependent methyltransferase
MSALPSSFVDLRRSSRDPGRADPVAVAHEAFGTPASELAAFLTVLARRHHLGERLRILDAACGSGYRLPALAGLGAEVLGMEVDPRLRASAESLAGPSIRVLAGRMDEIDAPACYDLALSWDGALCYVHDVAGRVLALRRLLRCLRPGGLLVLELPELLGELAHRGPYPLQRATLRDRTVVSRDVRHSLVPEQGVVHRQERVLVERADGRRASVELLHRMSIVSPQELAYGLRQAGFSQVETWPGVQASEPGPSAGPRLLVVARR